MIPVRLLDVAGLVPGAHEGKGLGNQFLDDLRQADGLLHVLDCSGLTDPEGKQRSPAEAWDPEKTIAFLEEEIDEWIFSILSKHVDKIEAEAKAKKLPLRRLLAEKLSGLGMTEADVDSAMKKADIRSREFATILRRISKPILIIANKIDLPSSGENYAKLKGGYDIVPGSAEAELALREAAEMKLIDYVPGSSDFRQVSEELNEKQKAALDFIKNGIMKQYGSTGMQDALNRLVFGLLGYIVVYPVASIGKLSDTKGNVLPDAHLVKKGTTLREFAGKVHSTMAEHFIGGLGVDRKKVGADHVLKDGDVVEILFSK